MKITNWKINLHEKATVTFEVANANELMANAEEWANCKTELQLTVKRVSKKRSLTQNSYLWVMVGMLADVLRTSKEECYIKMLERYGQREEQTFAVLNKAYDTLHKATKGYCTVIGEVVKGDNIYFNVAILRGSSTYDSREMSILIDGVISECNDLHISTMSKSEIALLSVN